VTEAAASHHGDHSSERREITMEYGIGGVLLLILVILAIVYLARRV
jgi:hypothetical protein